MIEQLPVGAYCRTKKGAHFEGVVVVAYDSLKGVPHVVLEATISEFEGCEHLYPSAQLEQIA